MALAFIITLCLGPPVYADTGTSTLILDVEPVATSNAVAVGQTIPVMVEVTLPVNDVADCGCGRGSQPADLRNGGVVKVVDAGRFDPPDPAYAVYRITYDRHGDRHTVHRWRC